MIARYRWRYSAKDGALSVSALERDGALTDSKQGPIVFPTYAGRRFKARVDTGHSDSTLSAVWRTRLPDIERHEVEMVGIGSTQCAATPYVRCLPLRFQEHLIRLRDVDICETLYGQPADVEALLGYDLLEGARLAAGSDIPAAIAPAGSITKPTEKGENMEQTAFKIIRVQAQDAAALLRI